MSAVRAAVEQQMGTHSSQLVEQLCSQESVFTFESIAGSTAIKLNVALLRQLATKQSSNSNSVQLAASSSSCLPAPAAPYSTDTLVKHGSNSSLDISSSGEDDDIVHDVLPQATPVRHFTTSTAVNSATRLGSGSSSTAVPTARQLLLYVMKHQWHSNQQLNLVRRALAIHLIQQANAAVLAASRAQVGAPDGPACGDPSKYCIAIQQAGEQTSTQDAQKPMNRLCCGCQCSQQPVSTINSASAVSGWQKLKMLLVEILMCVLQVKSCRKHGGCNLKVKPGATAALSRRWRVIDTSASSALVPSNRV